MHTLSSALDWIASKANQRPGRFLACFSILYFAITLAIASQRLLWYDELFTVELARLPSTGDIWQELACGTDLLPPLGCLLSRWSMGLCGDNAVAARLPAVIGVWLLCLSLYFLARRWTAPAYALAATLLPLATVAWRPYALEARPYGVVLGLAGLALVCWHEAAAGRGRPWTLAGLAASLAAALSCHYYAVLLFIPILVGEAVRGWQRRRLDVPMAVTLAAGGSVLLLLRPLIDGARAHVPVFPGTPEWSGLVYFYKFVLEFDLLPIVALLVLLAMFPRGQGRRTERSAGPAAYELAALAALVALPVFGLVLAKTVTNAFYARYVLAAIIGLVLVVVLTAHRAANGSPRFAAALLVILAGWLVVKPLHLHGHFAEQRAKHQALCAFLARQDPELPIALASPQTFLQTVHYGPPELTRRIVYLDSPKLSGRFRGSETDDMALLAMRRVSSVPIRIEDYSTFTTTHRRFLVYGQGGWLVPALLADHADLRLLSQELYRIEPLPAGGQLAEK